MYSAPTLPRQRLNVVTQLKNKELEAEPGTAWIYSNWGYIVAGAMAERATAKSYETLIRTLVFEPLGIESAGYGPTSGCHDTTQAWGHTTTGIPIQIDAPLLAAPAGTIHMSLEDWGKFIHDQLRGKMGLEGMLQPESYKVIHSDPFGTNSYGLGWTIGHVAWTPDQVINHGASNDYFVSYSVIDSAAGVAILAVCNQGQHYSVIDAVVNSVASSVYS